MRKFDDILNLAAQHHGSCEQVLEMARNEFSVADPNQVSDDR